MNQREHPRAMAVLRVLDLDNPDAAPLLARDLSVGGLYLLEQDWPVDTRRRMAIIHEATRIEIEARVVRVEEGGVALRFDGASQELERRIRQLLLDLVYEGAPLGEQRDAPRFKLNSPVLWVLGSAQYRSTLSDLSSVGATIRAERAPEIGTHIYVQLPIVDQRGEIPVVEEVHGCHSQVIRHTSEGFAVRFLGVSDGFRRAIRWWNEHPSLDTH